MKLFKKTATKRLLPAGLAGFVLMTAAAGAAAAADPVAIDSSALLAAHNQWREKTGVPPLLWSDKLAAVAQQWASHLAGTTCSQGHSGNEYGENLYWRSALIGAGPGQRFKAASPQEVVDTWGKEIKDYDYNDNSCHRVCGHYTQLVWRDTKEVGCAMAVCADKEQIWVCNYDPPGNMIGKKPY